MDNLLTRALVALSDAGVAFVVCDGVACILQGVRRSTHDLDLRVALDQANLARLVGVAADLGLHPRIPEPVEALLSAERRRAWVEEKHAVVYTLLAPDGTFALDVFLAYPLAFEELRDRADTFDVQGRSVLVSNKRDLITAKRAVRPPRKTDERDIDDLTELLDG